MRSYFLVGCLLVCGNLLHSSAEEALPSHRRLDRPLPSISAILREASEIALKQGEPENYWTDRVLLRLGELQVRAGDFESALRSIRASSYPYGRDMGLLKLAEALARAGKKQRA